MTESFSPILLFFVGVLDSLSFCLAGYFSGVDGFLALRDLDLGSTDSSSAFFLDLGTGFFCLSYLWACLDLGGMYRCDYQIQDGAHI